MNSQLTIQAELARLSRRKFISNTLTLKINDSPMPITITNVAESTTIVIVVLLAAFFLSFRQSQHNDLFPLSVTQELKGLGILTVVFSHIGYMLVTDSTFLYPLSTAAGIGVDLFLFMSGYGLTVAMLKKPLSAIDFYKRRLIKVLIPFWVVLLALFVANASFLHITYPLPYMIQSFLGWFPHAYGYEDVNSPFWYITWMLMFYALFPLVFMAERLWLTAIILAVISNLLVIFNPLDLQANWLHRLHTNAFSLGILLVWLLRNNQWREQLIKFRNESDGITRYVFITVMILFAAYMAAHPNAQDWPAITQLFKTMSIQNYVIEQTSSLLAMMGLIMVFSMKQFDNKFLSLFGVYSYETYLVHWPLMARYDVFFHTLPAWLAVLLWLVTFLAIGWLLQKITVPLGAWVDNAVKRNS